jgi:hypothetical protein
MGLLKTIAFALLACILLSGCYSPITTHKPQHASSDAGNPPPHYDPALDIPPGQGLPHRIEPTHTHLRAFGGGGESLALQSDAPQTSFGGADWQEDHQLLGITVVTSTGNRSNGNGNNGLPTLRKTWTEVDFLYGYAINGYDLGAFGYHPEQIYASASVGLSYYNYSSRYRYRRGSIYQDTSQTPLPPNSFVDGLGIPVQLQAVYMPYSHFGAGVTIFANLNTKQLNYGGAITLMVSLF